MKQFVKRIYGALPFKKEIFFLIRKIWIPKETIYRHLYFKGVFKVSADHNNEFRINHFGYQLENEIFWKGLTNGWEKESIKLWIKLCEKSDVIFDIGANTGVYSLIAKSVNSNSKVYAFEPVARVFEKLKKNIELNHFDIIPLQKAVSNNDGNSIIYDTQSEHIYSVTVNRNLASPNTKVFETEIETVTLNSLIRENNIEEVHLIKIDVETHEPEVLEGFSDYLYQWKPTILIEVLTDEVASRLDNIFRGHGYLFFNINELVGVRQVNEITKSDHYNFLLCNPEQAVKIGLIQSSKIRPK